MLFKGIIHGKEFMFFSTCGVCRLVLVVLSHPFLVVFFDFFGFEPAGILVDCFVFLIISSPLVFPIECIWIHYILPHMIQSNVEEAVRILYRAVDFAFSNLALDNIIVDVPSYFFLSTQVPFHLIESF